ncbi:MAG: 4Fe-4S dicluster domain-containing protein [Candidatus Kariarchaeaceae archaeon]
MCYNCGMCTAVCGHTDGEGVPVPRKTIRLLQLGLKDQLLESTDPWLCYYCGDCSSECPRGAEPGEMMMGMRRWLTAQYDMTGQSARLYTSTRAAIISVALWMLFPLVALLALHYFDYASVVTSEVKLNEFAPVEIIWWASHFYGVWLGLVLFSGGFRMYRKVMRTEKLQGKIPRSAYVGELKELITNFSFQKKWRDCKTARRRWLKHFLLVTGYALMLVLVIALLPWFQTDSIYPWYHPQRWIGYYATVVLMVFSADMIIGRLRKKTQIHKYSHHTDWYFPIFIFLVSFTGILVHIFRYAGMPWPTYIIYTIHLMIAAAMLSTEVGVGKWTHLLYRPLAHYLDAVKVRAKAIPDRISYQAIN